MKKFLSLTAITGLLFSMVAVIFGATAANATSGATLSLSGTPTFYAGSASPAFGIVYVPADGTPHNRLRVGIYDSTGSNLAEGTATHFDNPSNCFMPIDNVFGPVIGCGFGGYIDFPNGHGGMQSLDFDAGAFTMPTNPGEYTIKVDMYAGDMVSGQSATTTIQVGSASYQITFSANGGGGSQAAITTSGASFTLPECTFTPPSGKTFGGWVDSAQPNITLHAGDDYTVSQDTVLGAIWNTSGGGNNGGNGGSFTVAQHSSVRDSVASFSTLAVGAAVPGYTSTFSGYSDGNVVNKINFFLGEPYSSDAVFYDLPGATSQSGGSLATWNPDSNDCGISAIRVGGVSQNASSGITCQKIHAVDQNSHDQYWITFELSSPTAESISYDVKAGTFVVSHAGNYNFFTTLFNTTGGGRTWANITQAFDAAENNSTPSGSDVSFGFTVSPGERIFGQDVTIAASDLALSTDYSVVLRSTPQILASGRTVSSSFNTSVTIPDNLEAGWHSITFNATRSDGAAISEVVYFKINANGILLETTTTQPAELAYTPAPPLGSWFWALLILAMGLGAYVYGREFNPEFLRVMSLVRDENGELVFVKRRIKSEDF